MTTGLKIRRNKSGSVAAYWVAANCSRHAKGYPQQAVRLHGPESEWPARCAALTAELMAWIENRNAPVSPKSFDGTVSGLIDQYVAHELSPYHKVKATTRTRYDWEHSTLKRTVGARSLAKLSGVDFIRWAARFADPAKPGENRRVARAHDLMGAIRRVMSWGVVLALPHADRLNTMLKELEFEGVKARTEVVTFEQATAIIARAHNPEVNRPSIAMAQALQFELNLRQIDVIGEWVVDLESTSGIRNTSKNTRHPKRWDTGLTWGDIDQNFILRKLVSKTKRSTGVVAEFDLKLRPMVMAEILRTPLEQRFGPIVKNEETGLPYTGTVFRDVWRGIATDCGVPKSVQNRDSRAGGVTEARDSGASMPQVMGEGTHAKPSTTARYMRNPRATTDTVAILRVQHRQNTVRTKGEK